MLEENFLNQKMEALKKFPNINKDLIPKFKEALINSDDWDLIHMNPYEFAIKNNLPANETVDFFVHSAKVGIFDMNYNMICPRCGGITNSHDSLDHIEADEFFCAVCNVNNKSSLDDMVEVSFGIQKGIKILDVDPQKNIQNYFRYYFSSNYQKSNELIDHVGSNIRDFFLLGADQNKTIKIDPSLGNKYQIACIEKNSATFIHFSDSTNENPHVQILQNGFTIKSMNVSNKILDLKIENLSKETIGFLVSTPSPDVLFSIAQKFPTKVKRFLTAKDLLNNQSFRDLYRMQNLDKNMSLNVRSLTIMFTDLRGSTEMYDRAGDILAYQLVGEHFNILIESVRKYSGSVVKTMGDAIMATFSNPIDGFLTSLEMMKKIEILNQKWREKGYEVGLKVGLHQGSALAVVNDERLDYFGHSVNVAARVQGLASSGEIWISESIFETKGVEESLVKHGYSFIKNSASLKGVGEKATVYKCFVKAA